MFFYIVALLLAIHGSIHVLGFLKAFRLATVPVPNRHITKTGGLLWLLTMLFFAAAFCLLLLKKDTWWMFAIPATLQSQLLIFTNWKEAKMGSIANFLLLVAALLSFGSWNFGQKFRADAANSIRSLPKNIPLLKDEDLRELPRPVQAYLRYAGVVNRPRVYNFKLVMEGRLREKGKDWFAFRSEQYNVVDQPTRLFFAKANMYGLTVPGYHRYQEQQASMDIRLFGLFPMVYSSGPEASQAETVTFLNDLCFFAPAALVDPRIQWTGINDSTAQARFTNGRISITARLFFNAEGALVNFVSDDRYILPQKLRYRFSTPVGLYRLFNGRRLAFYGEAIWHYPDGPFTYGTFRLKEVQYNIQ